MTRPAARRWLTRHHQRERGVTLPLVALMLVVLLGMASLVIDLGNGWFTRRGLIQATDSAALAAAQDFANPLVASSVGCGVTAPGYVAANQPGATMTACTRFNYSTTRGRVSVTATHPVQTYFAPVIGLGNYTTTSTSTAVWGPPASVTGLRPIGLCAPSSPQLLSFINSPPTSPVDITIVYGSNQPNACGTGPSPGNWGIVDFDGGSNPNTEINNWLNNGYPGQVTVGNHTVTTCVGEAHCYQGQPGSGINNSLSGALNSLVTSQVYFTVPLFNYYQDQGGTLRFHLFAILRVRLLSYDLTGNQAQRSLTFRVMPGLVTGICCGPPGGASGNSVVAICGVDPNAFAACGP